VRLLRAGGPEVFQGGSFRAVLDSENPLPSDHPGVQRFSSAARLHPAGDGGCDGWLAGSPGRYDRHSGAQGPWRNHAACLERPMRPHNGRREPVLVVDWAVIRNVA